MNFETKNKYQLLTGQQIEGEGGYCLRAYRVEQSGNIVRVFNLKENQCNVHINPLKKTTVIKDLRA